MAIKRAPCVAVNAVGVIAGGGLGHLLGLVGSWRSEHGASSKLIVFARGSVVSELDSTPLVELVPVSPAGFGRVVWDLYRFERAAARKGADLLWSLANLGPVLHRRPHIIFQRNLWYFTDDDRLDGYPVDRHIKSRLARLSVRFADLTVCPSPSMASVVASVTGRPASEIKVLPHPVESLAGEDRSVPSMTEPDVLSISCVAHTGAHKRHIELIQAFGELAEQRNDIELVLTIPSRQEQDYVGSEFLGPVLAARAELPEPVAARVRCIGPVSHSDAHVLMKESAVTVVPSDLESFSYPVYESLVNGTPVVATAIPAHKDATDYGPVCLYTPGSTTALVQGLRKSLEAVIPDAEPTGLGDLQILGWPEYVSAMERLFHDALGR